MNADDIRRSLTSIEDPVVDAVSRWDVCLDVDDTGEPVVDVVVVFRDSDIRRVWNANVRFQQVVRDFILERFPGRWPYVSFAAESEALNPEEAAA